jgi:hypothetical protein
VFSSYFTSANFVVIPARITPAPATMTSKSEREKKRASSKTKKERKKESDHATHPQGPAIAWCCSHVAT